MDEKEIKNNEEIKGEETIEESSALSSFLSRDVRDDSKETKESTKTETEEKPKKKMKKSTKWILIGACAAVLLAGVICLLIFLPKNEEPTLDMGTDVTDSVDENGMHQAKVVTNENGELENNSFGTLLSYAPANIKKIDVENKGGSFTVTAETPKTENEDGEEESGTTVYTIVGFEDIPIEEGKPDAIANDASRLDFLSVASLDGNKSDFGFDSPRAVVKTFFDDDTSAMITVGDEAAKGAGTYVTFGTNDTVYLVENDAVDALLYNVLDLVTLTVNQAADDTANADFQRLTLSGKAFSDDIVLAPNDDKAIDSTYVMLSPKKMYISEVEGANISGDIRGLHAEKAVCVNPTDSQLSEYGLSSPYAVCEAIYSDTTVTLYASQPKDDSVYLLQKGSKVIYSMKAENLSWVTTDMEKLRSEIVLDPNKESVSKITVKDSSGTYTFDVATTTQTVTNDKDEEEEVTTTSATYNGEKLDDTNFAVFFQNICEIQNVGEVKNASLVSPKVTVTFSYSTGRDDDTINIYDYNDTKMACALNGETVGLVYKSFVTKFETSVQDLISGNTVASI
ncbi:MAG: DUF4340 domain-containing protein [Oscillospiraceae bacterium]|nr:DUF4340 domain-containing protein [Candidatus Ruminococcus equi]